MTRQTIALQDDELIDVQQVGGNVRVDGWDPREIEARGDLIRVERRPGVVVVSCGGDLTLNIPKSARLALNSIGGNVHLEGLTGALELSMVGGDAALRNLAGSVRLTGMIGGELHMENVANISMTSGKPGDRFGVAEQVRRKVEQAAHRADSRMRRAEHRGFQPVRMGGLQGAFGRSRPGSRRDTAAPSQPDEAVSDEERMTILRMLQEKKITAEQAEQLLTALEGNR